MKIVFHFSDSIQERRYYYLLTQPKRCWYSQSRLIHNAMEGVMENLIISEEFVEDSTLVRYNYYLSMYNREFKLNSIDTITKTRIVSYSEISSNSNKGFPVVYSRTFLTNSAKNIKTVKYFVEKDSVITTTQNCIILQDTCMNLVNNLGLSRTHIDWYRILNFYRLNRYYELSQ